MVKKLRILHVLVQPVLVWDNGEELKPFEHETPPIKIPVSEFMEFGEKIKSEVEEANDQQNDENSKQT